MAMWIRFFATAAVILVAGTQLSRYGDIIAEKTGLGRAWIGVVLLTTVTSLPELVTGVSSVAVFHVPNIAAGDVLGSSMFNLLILALIDVLSGPIPISARAHQGHVLTAAFGVLLLGLTTLGIAARDHLPAIGWVGLFSPVLLMIYVVAMRLIFPYERRRIAQYLKEVAEGARYGGITSTRAYVIYGLNAVLIVGTATYLPRVADEIARTTGLGQTVVGNLVVAGSTSLPEIAVSIAALRLGAVDMVVGNLLGSNLFNIAILAIDDLFYVRGPLFAAISGTQLVAAVAAMSMTAVTIIGFTYRVVKKRILWSWDALSIIGIYILAAYLLIRLR